MRLHLAVLALLFTINSARANVCGTDYQSFNPTTNGLDFVTVQSSETLRPCFFNLGIFFNYAANSLTYSKSLNTNYKSGQKRKDRILSSDLSLGTGLTDRWDIGINVPVVLSQTVQDDYYVSSFDEYGATELKLNTKYRISGGENGGIAAVVSLNKNLIQDNPFAGRDPGLTYNYELVADTTFQGNWAGAINLGYRDRNPGPALSATIPFVPLQDQWIYSIAGSYLFSQIDTKLILELYGSRVAVPVNQDTDRAMNSLEALAGVKYDASQNLALHFGMATQVDTSLGGADFRVYAGLNWAIGPVCKTAVVEEMTEVPAPTPEKPAENLPEVYKLDTELLFPTNKEVIEPEQLAALDPILQELLKKGFVSILIEGHSDSVGDVNYNKDLSERRAKFMRTHLIEKYKIPADKVSAVGYGDTQPLADNGNYQGRRKNRRVELKIWRLKQP